MHESLILGSDIDTNYYLIKICKVWLDKNCIGSWNSTGSVRNSSVMAVIVMMMNMRKWSGVVMVAGAVMVGIASLASGRKLMMSLRGLKTMHQRNMAEILIKMIRGKREAIVTMIATIRYMMTTHTKKPAATTTTVTSMTSWSK